MILDSSFLIDLMNGDGAAHDRARQLQDDDVVQRLPAPVVYELRHGAALLDDEDERRRVRNVLGMYPIVRLDRQLAELAGRLHGAADRAAGGHAGLDQVDPMVAAVADVLDEPVLTDNEADFRALGVGVETY